MSGKNLSVYPIFFLILIGLVVLGWWFLHDPVDSFTISMPGMDKRETGRMVAADTVKIGEEFTFFKTVEGIPGIEWPRFRGEDFDNISKESTKLIEKWGKEGPRILWKINLGEGRCSCCVRWQGLPARL